MKEKMLRAAREKSRVTHKGKPIRLTADLSAETLQARREWGPTFNILKEKNFQPRISYPAKLSFIKSCSVTQAVVQWNDFSLLEHLPSKFKQFLCLSTPKTGFHYVAQAGLKLLTSGDPPALPAQSAWEYRCESPCPADLQEDNVELAAKVPAQKPGKGQGYQTLFYLKEQSSIMKNRLKEEQPMSANGARGAESACRVSSEAKVTKNGKASEEREVVLAILCKLTATSGCHPQPTSVSLEGLASALSFRLEETMGQAAMHCN
ncbi:LINE-1 retrotransposable element ORF1 protein, partial [Plecturocebus cupreus]